MKKIYGVLFLAIGLFNMYVGFSINGTGYYRFFDMFGSLFSNSGHYFPLMIFSVGLIYFLIGLILLFKNSKVKAVIKK